MELASYRGENENNSIFKPRVLTLEDLPWLQKMGRIEGAFFILEKSHKDRKLKTKVPIKIDELLSVGQVSLIKYILDSFLIERPVLIPFVLENRGLIDMAKYFLRYRSGSTGTLYGYTDRIWRYCKRLRKVPDELIADVKKENGALYFEKIQEHVKALESYIFELQDKGLSPGMITNYAKAIRALYRVNGIRIDLPYSISRKPVVKDRAPTAEELSKLLEIADLREKVIISMLALGGFREGTLVKLRYKHVKKDLEARIVPTHIHIEATITKGKYHDYDTFIGAEAAEFLRLYLDSRRNGSPDGKIPPEEIGDESPLIRSIRKVPKPIAEKAIRKIVHNLYFKAGLLERGGYVLKVHSLRKFFKTQLMALGVQSDYIDYMMGHTIDTYHDVQSKGVEFLRGIYAARDFGIRPRPKLSVFEQMKVICRGMGIDPDKALVQEAFAEPHRAIISSEDMEARQIQALSSAIKEKLKDEILAEVRLTESPESLLWNGGPVGIRTRVASSAGLCPLRAFSYPG
jgi:site-specific recombinase XerD